MFRGCSTWLKISIFFSAHHLHVKDNICMWKTIGGKSHLQSQDFHIPASVFFGMKLLLLESHHSMTCNSCSYLRITQTEPLSRLPHLLFAGICVFFSEILVGLSFFDDIIDADVERKMVANLKLPPSKECMKRLHNPPELKMRDWKRWSWKTWDKNRSGGKHKNRKCRNIVLMEAKRF